MYNDVFRWHVEKNEWKHIESLNTPPPRCSHQAVCYRDRVYIFGGEYATLDQFYHYRDLWYLDLKTNIWHEIRPQSQDSQAPSPRSGHRMILWRNCLVVFGGFYEALREVKWFNDLFFFHLGEERWIPIPIKSSSTSSIPKPRSGFVMGLHAAEDILYIYGGFSKEKETVVSTLQNANQTHSNNKNKNKSQQQSQQDHNKKKSESKVHTDMWMLNLKSIMPTISSHSGKVLVDASKAHWQKVCIVKHYMYKNIYN